MAVCILYGSAKQVSQKFTVERSIINFDVRKSVKFHGRNVSSAVKHGAIKPCAQPILDNRYLITMLSLGKPFLCIRVK